MPDLIVVSALGIRAPTAGEQLLMNLNHPEHRNLAAVPCFADLVSS